MRYILPECIAPHFYQSGLRLELHEDATPSSRVDSSEKGFKTEFTRGPGRGDTCHLSNLDTTLPDWRDYQTTLKDKVGRLCDFSLES